MGQHLKATLYSRTGFPDLMNLKQAAEYSKIDEPRLLQLAQSGYAPCCILDDSKYLFFKKDLMDWVKDHLIKIQDGTKIGDDVKIVTPLRAEFSGIPEALHAIADKLKQLDMTARFSCVYFLVKGSEVVYVGQSISLASRIEQHRSDKEFDRVLYFLYPEYGLDSLEAAFIRHLRPKYNRSQVTSEMDSFHFEQLEKISFLPPDKMLKRKENLQKALESL